MSVPRVGWRPLEMISKLFTRRYLLVTNCVLCSSLSGAGELVQQTVKRAGRRCDTKRARNMALAGLPTGVLTHYWYIYVDRFVLGKTFGVAMKKVVLDQIIFSPIMWLMFLSTFTLLQEHNACGLVLGSTSGIGTECGRLLAAHKAHLVCLVRNTKLAHEHIDQWRHDSPDIKVDVVECDLDSLQSVKDAAQKYIDAKWVWDCPQECMSSGYPLLFNCVRRPLHVLLLNAGVSSPTDGTSTDGLDRTFVTNHLGHFYLTQLLLDTIKQTNDDDKRIVVVSSEAHKMSSIKTNIPVDDLTESFLTEPYKSTGMMDNFKNYGRSKLYNIWFARELALKVKEDNISVSVLHPGVISTGLTGYYYDSCWPREPNALAQRVDLAQKLWVLSQQLVHKFETGQLAKKGAGQGTAEK